MHADWSARAKAILTIDMIECTRSASSLLSDVKLVRSFWNIILCTCVGWEATTMVTHTTTTQTDVLYSELFY